MRLYESTDFCRSLDTFIKHACEMYEPVKHSFIPNQRYVTARFAQTPRIAFAFVTQHIIFRCDDERLG